MAGGSSAPIHYRINFVTGFALVSVACLFFFTGLLFMITGIGEIVTEILDAIGSVLFFVWFTLLGANFFGSNPLKKVGAMLAGSIVAVTPFINGVAPALPIETATMIAIMRKEDRVKAQKSAKQVEAAMATRTSQQAYQIAMRKRQQAEEASLEATT